jgi:methyl-accepting chemotaxis protein
MLSFVRNLSLRTQLAICGLLALTPVVAITLMFLQQLNKDITFSQKEIDGLEHIRPVWDTMKTLAYTETGAQIRVSESDIQLRLAAAHEKHAANLESAEGFKNFSTKLQAAGWPRGLKAGQPGNTAAMSQTHEFIRDLGDLSNLTLDPDLDTFYLMEIATMRLPQMVERTVALHRQINDLVEKANRTDRQRGDLFGLTGNFEADLSDISRSVERAIKGNPEGQVKAAVSDAFRTFSSRSKTVAIMMKRYGVELADRGEPSVGVEEINPSIRDMLLALDAFWSAAAGSLDERLAVRVGGLNAKLMQVTVLSIGLSVICLIIGLYLSNAMVTNLHRLRLSIDGFANGELDSSIALADRRTEIGRIAGAVDRLRNVTMERMDEKHTSERDSELARQRRELLDGIAAQISGQIDALIGDMKQASQALISTVDLVSGNAQDTQIHMVTTSQRLDGATANVLKVASSITQLAQTTREIATQSATAASVADKARSGTDRVRGSIAMLEDSVQKIGAIGGMITGIASQTNLLALNATIEAARAGEAGRGFAVVAGEVKALAGQTAQATDDIANQISSIRQAVSDVVDVVNHVVTVIDDITSVSAAIATATEQQSVTTDEINFNIEETAVDSRAVSDVLKDVTNKSIDTSEKAAGLSAIAANLSGKAGEVERTMAKLLGDLKAA